MRETYEKIDPVCRKCDELFSNHIIVHDPADIPRGGHEGDFAGVEGHGIYCPVMIRVRVQPR